MRLIEFIKEFGLELTATLAVMALGVMIAKFRRSFVITVFRLLVPELRQSGLINVYSSMKTAAKAIISSVERTHDLKILSNKGTDWIGDDNAILSAVVSRRAIKGLKLRVLLLGINAPWLGARWIERRGKPSQQFAIEEFKIAHNLVESYMEKHQNLRHKSDVRYHRDDPVWRLLITDDRVFVSSYAIDDQARDAAVFEFEGPQSETYRAYKRYFNFLWHRRGVTRGSIVESILQEGKFDSFEISTGGVVYSRVDGEVRFLLVESEYGFTLPKGHLKDNEDFKEAALREIHEETNLPIDRISIEKNLGWYTNPLAIGDKERLLKIIYYFLASYNGDTLPTLRPDTDHRAAEWYTVNELSNIRFAYPHIERVVYHARRVLGQNV